MRFPWQKILDAISTGLGKPVRPHAVDEAIDRDGMTPEERAEYDRTHEASPDAPHIDEGGI